MTAVVDVLGQHVDDPADPDRRHRCVLVDRLRIRCLDCLRTIDLRPLLSAVPGSTSTSTSPPPLHAPDRCELHPGQRTGACGPCRAEQLEAARQVDERPTADVAAGAAAVRGELAQIAVRRRTPLTTPKETG